MGVTWEEPPCSAVAVLAQSRRHRSLPWTAFLSRGILLRWPGWVVRVLGCVVERWKGGWDPDPGVKPSVFHFIRHGHASCTAVTRGMQKGPGGRRSWRCAACRHQPALHEINTFVPSSQAPGIWGWSLACQLFYALSHYTNMHLGTYRKPGRGWIVLMQSVIDYTYMTYMLLYYVIVYNFIIIHLLHGNYMLYINMYILYKSCMYLQVNF